MKKMSEKSREIISYCIFGLLTTVISWAVYFSVLECAKHLFSLSDDADALYGVRVFANVLSWILSVLFAFFTNKKYVFHDDDNKRSHVVKKMVGFYSSRFATFLLDMGVTLGIVWLLENFGFTEKVFSLLGKSFTLNPDLVAKLVSGVLVVVVNYVVSKLFVFRKSE